MDAPLINILTRHLPARVELMERLQQSIDYDNFKHIVYTDSRESWMKSQWDWNLFCNGLKAKVVEGYFVYADDDDYFKPGALMQVAEYLARTEADGLICQYLRHGRAKPPIHHIEGRIIQQYFIGGGALVLHSKFASVADWDSDGRCGDYRWIKRVSERVHLHFAAIVLQITDNGGRFGK